MRFILLKFLFFHIYFCFAPQKISLDDLKRLIVWNVGQGQWVTLINNNKCVHMDAGGEFFPKRKILEFCQKRKNQFYFSHADKDHINFFHKISYHLPSLCLVNPPKKVLKKLTRNKKIPICSNENSSIATIFSPRPLTPMTSNEQSHVFVIEKQVLNPGDSVEKNEKIWAQSNSLEMIEILVLGHHGSNTSTSHFLLRQLRHLRLAISSSRKGRYGHPHGLVKIRLQKNKTPLLSTEQWGNIVLYL